MAKPPPALNAGLVRRAVKGEARAVPVETLEPPQPAQEAQEADNEGIIAAIEDRAHDTRHLVVQRTHEPLRPEPPPTLNRKQMATRLPLELTEGLRIMAFYTRLATQEIMSMAVEAELDRWNPQWRTLLPK